MTGERVAYVIGAVVVPVLLLAPATLLWVLWRGGRRADRATFLRDLPAMALVLPALGWFVEPVVLWQVLGIHGGRQLALGVWLAACGLLVGACTRLRRWTAWRRLVWGTRGPLARYLVFAVWCAVLAGWDVTSPVTGFDSWHVSKRRTFGTYWTHDNLFQFVNGRAIAREEPFERYYGGGKLVFPVTSREMLPGVEYAGFRRVVAGVARRWEDSYGLFLLFGIAWNATAVLALEALRLRLRLRAAWPALAILCSTSLFLVNGWFAWFKLAGAAFFTGGLLAARDARRTGDWAWAGVLWGCGSAMHLGTLLGVPPFALAYALRARRTRQRPGVALAAAVLGTSLVLAPWQIVKAVWLVPDHRLISAHYLNRIHEATLAASVARFLRETPPAEQATHRLRNVAVALRLPELVELLTPWRQAPVAWAVRLAQYRFLYTAIALYPLLLLGGPAVWWRARGRAAPTAVEIGRLTVLALGTLAGLWVVEFSPMLADQTSHQPIGVLLLAVVLLADGAVRTRAGRWAVAGLCATEGVLTVSLLLAGVGQEPVAPALVRYVVGRWLW